jgi:hypothetical protein
MFHVLQALELFALQNTFQGELSERAPELIVLPIDHTEVGFHCGRTRKDVAMPQQNVLNLANRCPRGCQPSAKLTMMD